MKETNHRAPMISGIQEGPRYRYAPRKKDEMFYYHLKGTKPDDVCEFIDFTMKSCNIQVLK